MLSKASRGALTRLLLAPSHRATGRNVSTKTLDVVKQTLPLVAEAGTEFTSHFYKRMFADHPELLNIFNTSNQRKGRQQKALFSSIAASATSLVETGELPHAALEGIHHKHCALNCVPDQYNVVGKHILGTIVDLLDPPSEVLEAWKEVYGVLAHECIEGSERLYREVEAKEGGWRGERDFRLARKSGLSHSVIEFVFEPVDGKAVCDFTPGQYTTLWLQGQGWKNRQPRHYTLIGEPNKKDYTIAVKKETDGLVSSYLHDRVAPGDVLQMSAPYGNFYLSEAQKLWTEASNKPVVFLSAGIGITPTLSMLGSIKNEQRSVLWLHAAENGEEHPFRSYLVGLARAKTEGICTHVVCVQVCM